MSIVRDTLDSVIRIQQSIPVMLPNEFIAWRSYNRKFSKVCDSCNSEKGVYKVTYQDAQIPRTIVYPYPVRLCTDCFCEADEKVGVINDNDEVDDGKFCIDRK
jgi:hypothetical protein